MCETGGGQGFLLPESEEKTVGGNILERGWVLRAWRGPGRNTDTPEEWSAGEAMLAVATGTRDSQIQRLKDMETQPKNHGSACREEKPQPSELREGQTTSLKTRCSPVRGSCGATSGVPPQHCPHTELLSSLTGHLFMVVTPHLNVTCSGLISGAWMGLGAQDEQMAA